MNINAEYPVYEDRGDLEAKVMENLALKGVVHYLEDVPELEILSIKTPAGVELWDGTWNLVYEYERKISPDFYTEDYCKPTNFEQILIEECHDTN